MPKTNRVEGEVIRINLTGSDALITRRVLTAMKMLIIGSVGNLGAWAPLLHCRGDDFQLAEKITDFVRSHIEYQFDPEETEYVCAPHVVWKTKRGDCDDMTVLWFALAINAGLPIEKMVIQSVKYAGEKYFSHVYPLFNNVIFDPCIPKGNTATVVKGDKFLNEALI